MAVSVCADGSKLPPMFIFKGTQNGWIAKKEFANFPPSCKYSCPENTWVDKRAMIEWDKNILKPYIEMAPKNVVLLLVLDSHWSHMMTSVVEAIQQLGAELEHIPGGCTSLCWPVDVGINKTLKTFVCKDWEDWEDWMLESGFTIFVVKPPI